MGQDSWQAEQRSPYLRANAGNAFAFWLPLRTRKTRTRDPSRKFLPHDDVAHWRDCVPICMPHSSGKIRFFRMHSHKMRRATSLSKGTVDPSTGVFSGRKDLNRFSRKRSYHRTGAESY